MHDVSRWIEGCKAEMGRNIAIRLECRWAGLMVSGMKTSCEILVICGDYWMARAVKSRHLS